MDWKKYIDGAVAGCCLKINSEQKIKIYKLRNMDGNGKIYIQTHICD
jgi:hypothetical protein